MRVIGWLLTLAGAIWSTGNIMLLLIAPAAFKWAPPHADLISRAGAGAVFGSALETWSTAVVLPLVLAMVALGWLTGTAWRNGRKPLTGLWLALMCGVWGVHSVNRSIVIEANQVATVVRELKTHDLANDKAAETELAARELRFGELHIAATRWHTVETLIALGLLVGGSVLVLRRPGARPEPAAP